MKHRRWLIVLAVLIFSMPISSFSFHDTLRFDPNYKIANEADLRVILKYFVPHYYYKEITDSNKLFDCVINRGLTGCLDKNSERINPENAKLDAEERESKGFGGVGLAFFKDKKDDLIKVEEVFDGGPAERAGIKAGDVIVGVEVNGVLEQIENKSPDEIRNMIRGPVGTKVEIVFKRSGERRKVVLQREVIQLKHVRYRMLDGSIGYVQVRTFDSVFVANQFKEAMDSLIVKNANAVVIDLRFNGGGLLSEVNEMLAFFESDSNAILVTAHGRERTGKEEDIHYRVSGTNVAEIGKYEKMKIAVLINKHSASASEIMAAYLKYKGAAVIGEKSYCKGTIQVLLDLPSGGILKLTIAEYFVSNARIKVDEVCVEPDYPVLNGEQWELRDRDNDLQLKKAIEILNKL